MKLAGVVRTLLILAVAFGVLSAAGFLDVDVTLKERQAEAKGFFGDDEEAAPAKADPFWVEGSESGVIATPPGGAPPSFAELAEQVSPAVVNIRTERTITPSQRRRHPLEEFFGGQPFGELFQMPRNNVPSLGTGFIISDDGYIVTNNHVIEDVDKIVVQFQDEETAEATVVGRDPKTDVALIRIEVERELPYLPLGDSDRIRPGDWVIAIGNPFGLEHTVTAGIVSAKHREINQRSESRRFDDFIQTDAAINPGNSGGPLLNLRGQVVGINTAINPRANTIGFAVPVNLAKSILPQLRASGRVSRGWLGVYIEAIDEDKAELMGLPDRSGALVSKVEPEGPAAEGGLKAGDVIVEFNGQAVEEMEKLPKLVAAAPVGSEAAVVVLRKGKKKTLSVELGELERGEQLARASLPSGEAPTEKAEAYGLEVKELTPDVAEQLGMEDEEGILVTGVEPGSSAAEAGLRQGDVILQVNQEEVGGLSDFRDSLSGSEKGALLLVRRGNVDTFIALRKKTG
ncbi:MAG: Do family serine endopeptidase [Myxococcota bacterium]|nr:Do family serine endopeptidase [Myxococcota bacterium]